MQQGLSRGCRRGVGMADSSALPWFPLFPGVVELSVGPVCPHGPAPASPRLQNPRKNKTDASKSLLTISATSYLLHRLSAHSLDGPTWGCMRRSNEAIVLCFGTGINCATGFLGSDHTGHQQESLAFCQATTPGLLTWGPLLI